MADYLHPESYGLNSQPSINNQKTDYLHPESYGQAQDQSSQIPQDVRSAQSVIGSQGWNGYCQQFVEQVAYGKSGMFPTALSAAQSYAQNGQLNQGLEGAKPGDILYWNGESTGGDGHASIYEGTDPQGNPMMISATDTGVREDNVSQWAKDTNQQLLGFVSTQ
jgi:hypothetical protein